MNNPTNAKSLRIEEAQNIHPPLERLDDGVSRVSDGNSTHRIDEVKAEVPSIPEELIAKWQRIVDLMAKTIGVPAGLVMRVDAPQIEVFVSSKTEGNPYEKGERADLDTGLYCETVMKQRGQLLVPNALKDPDWDHNPDIELDMISYLGLPLQWPDGTIFGTICVLDRAENSYSALHKDLLAEFSETINIDLERTTYLAEREHLNQELTKARDHLEATVKRRTKELANMCIDLKKSEEALRVSESELKAIYDNAPLVIMLLNEEQRIVKANAWTQCIAQRSEKEVIGLCLGQALRCVHASNPPEGCGDKWECEECGVRDTLLHTIRSGKVVEAIHSLKVSTARHHPNGSPNLHMLLSMTPLSISGKDLVLVCIKNITERIQAEAKLLNFERQQAEDPKEMKRVD